MTITVTDDDGAVGSDTLTVTVFNVAPTINTLSTSSSNPQFVLPGVHGVMFTADFTDPGWLDTHTASWDYGEGSIEAGTVVEENTPPDSTGDATGQHICSAPGLYTVTLTITDDGATDTMTTTVNVVTVEEAVIDTNNYVQTLPDDAFSKKAKNQKTTLDNKFSAVLEKLDADEYMGAINQLESIRKLVDGMGNDWITDPMAQLHLCMKIDDIIAYLTMLL